VIFATGLKQEHFSRIPQSTSVTYHIAEGPRTGALWGFVCIRITTFCAIGYCGGSSVIVAVQVWAEFKFHLKKRLGNKPNHPTGIP